MAAGEVSSSFIDERAAERGFGVGVGDEGEGLESLV